jgi:sensor histidine kinase regulating citrate/malate metabolism
MGRMFQFCQIYAICFCVLMLVLQVLQHRDLVIQKKMAVNQTLWEQRQMQYQISKENIDLINRKCHDMKHQIAALMQMGGDNLQREQFVEDVQNMIEIYDSAPDTGNEVLNTILAQRSLYCNMHNIQWSCMADGTVLTFMENIDLYTLMGNALDNAVESVEKLSDPKQRRIDLQIGQREAFAVIQVQNPFYGTVKIKNGLPVTSKVDRQNHGFGVRSIRSIAERYQGSASVRTENGVFVLNVVIPLPKQE